MAWNPLHGLADVLCLRTVRVNICPFQGSRTIRTEEAVLISLARLSPFVARNGNSEVILKKSSEGQIIETDLVEFSDEAPSDESSSGSSIDD